MTTKTIMAQHLHAGDRLVEGGDGTRRVALPICELRIGQNITALVRGKEGFEPRSFERRDRVRVQVTA